MYAQSITIGTNTYDLTTQRANSSLRSDASTGLDNPNLMTVSHDTASNGKVSSVIIFDSEEVIPCNDTCVTSPQSDNIRVMMKIQYNPTSGRAAIATEIDRLRVLLDTFTSDATNWGKFINKES